ncbi:MAG: xylulokinase [Candidatus Marinimicrobia bacterium]|nr:xylulokinase [Candidatus Neomarinimicrobiota bacterium]MCF7827422.1 xylulokinase [Candidatus Neomarinimicrobiota bacterium]MCF7881345.1 xylulokinase [Candidatus Neomarinimicrobiota bacterium]
MYFAGLDVSTQSCKLVVIDDDSKDVVFVTAVNYDNDLPEYETKNGVIQGLPTGASESDPNMWLEAVDRVFGELTETDIPVEEIRCISVSGQQHGLVALDEKGDLTRPTSKLWNDFSTQEECEILTEKIGGLDAMIEEVGNSQRTGYTAAKIFHMVRHEPERYKKTTTLFLVHNYINWYLTGGVRVMEPGDTSGIALWDPRTGEWSGKVIQAIDSNLRDKLPPVEPSDATIGDISPSLAERFGFSTDCRIDAGSGDNMYGAIGTGNVTPGLVTVSLGTSGTAYSFMEEPYVDPTGEIAAFCDSTGHYLPLLCVSNLANGYNEILNLHEISHDEFNKIVSETEPGNSGKLLIPWYEGERTPDVPQAAPIYFGFGLDDFTRETLSRAVLEGHILSLYDGFRRMPIEVDEIRLTGGMSQSPAWCQTIADVFNAETVPVQGEGAALGAAVHASWAWKKENSTPETIEEAVEPYVILDEQNRKTPIPEYVEIHNIQKELFRALSLRVRGKDGKDPFALREQMEQ